MYLNKWTLNDLNSFKVYWTLTWDVFKYNTNEVIFASMGDWTLAWDVFKSYNVLVASMFNLDWTLTWDVFKLLSFLQIFYCLYIEH